MSPEMPKSEHAMREELVSQENDTFDSLLREGIQWRVDRSMSLKKLLKEGKSLKLDMLQLVSYN